MSRDIQPGERFRVTRIDTPDPDCYAVINYEGGYAFGCGREWFEKNKPTVGGVIEMGTDHHWFVPKQSEP